jgi:O-antigen ligase
MKAKETLVWGIYLAAAAAAIDVILKLFAAPLSQALVVILGATVLFLPIIWQRPEFGLALVGFFLPFERIPSLDIGGMSLKINHVLILVVLVSYILTSLIKGKLKIPRDPIKIFVLIFLFALALSLPVAINRARALQVFAFMILMVLTYLTVTLVAQDKKSIIWAVKGILWGAVVVGALGLFQFFGDMIGLPATITLLKQGYDKSTFGFARVQALSAEPLYFANYIFIPLLIGVAGLVQGQIEKIFPKWATVALSIVLLINFILAISRGAYIGAGVVLILFLAVQAKVVFQLKNILAFILIGGVIFTGSYLALLKSEPRAIDEFIAHLEVQDRQVGESVVSRLNASQQALEIFQDHPLFGAGLGNFGPIVQNDPSEKPETGWFIVNDEYLELLAENGAVGLIAFVVLCLAILIRSAVAYFRSQDKLLKALILGLSLALVGILVQYATFSTLYIFHIWFLIGLLAAICNVALSQKHKLKN